MALKAISESVKSAFPFDAGIYCWIRYIIILACAVSCLHMVQFLVQNSVHESMSIHALSMVTKSGSNSFLTDEQKLVLDSSDKRLDAKTKKETDLSRMVFAIAGAAGNWPRRKEYIKKWYNIRKGIRAVVWLDQEVNGTWDKDVPPFQISSHHPRFVVRIARIVSDTFRLELPDIDWFIMGDDDTLFFPDNLARVLSKYNHKKMYYIGSNSEAHSQNLRHSYNMAFGGGGFAISYTLAKELAKMQESCLNRYQYLIASDERIQACASELGVSLTKELGFHQMDIKGDAMGLLGAHPQVPLVSIHHMDWFDPIFPRRSRQEAVDHLLEAAKVESASVLQQGMCFEKDLKWSFVVSWGYVVQGYKGFIPPRELERPLRTFNTILNRNAEHEYDINTRPFLPEICSRYRPTLFYMQSVKGASADTEGLLESVYMREADKGRDADAKCCDEWQPLSSVQRIRVLKEPVKDSWFETPRRSCCKVKAWSNDTIDLRLSECGDGENLTGGIFQ